MIEGKKEIGRKIKYKRQQRWTISIFSYIGLNPIRLITCKSNAGHIEKDPKKSVFSNKLEGI